MSMVLKVAFLAGVATHSHQDFSLSFLPFAYLVSPVQWKAVWLCHVALWAVPSASLPLGLTQGAQTKSGSHPGCLGLLAVCVLSSLAWPRIGAAVAQGLLVCAWLGFPC
jgi:hypothetical protein